MHQYPHKFNLFIFNKLCPVVNPSDTVWVWKMKVLCACFHFVIPFLFSFLLCEKLWKVGIQADGMKNVLHGVVRSSKVIFATLPLYSKFTFPNIREKMVRWKSSWFMFFLSAILMQRQLLWGKYHCEIIYLKGAKYIFDTNCLLLLGVQINKGKITVFLMKMLTHLTYFPKEAFKEQWFCSHLILMYLTAIIFNCQTSSYWRSYFHLWTLLLKKNLRYTTLYLRISGSEQPWEILYIYWTMYGLVWHIFSEVSRQGELSSECSSTRSSVFILQ